MMIKEYLEKLSNNEQLNEIKYNIVQTFSHNEQYLDMAMAVGRSISKFAESQSPLSFIEGGISVFTQSIKVISGKTKDFFTEKNGWKTLTHAYYNRYFYDILSSVLVNYPNRELKFGYDSDKPIIYTLPSNIQIAKTAEGLFYRFKDNDKEKILQILINEKIKSLNSKLFVITEGLSKGKNSDSVNHRYDLIGEEIISFPSKYASDLANYIKSFIDKGFSRSMIIQGVPGTGKSCVSQSVIKDLDLNTLKFKYTRLMDISMVQFLIKSLNINAVVLDDFEYSYETEHLLGFLEWLNRNVKLTLAITNSLKGLPIAMLRPNRIDEIRVLNTLDDGVLKSVLGEFYDKLKDQVKLWPIAYIGEITKRLKTNPDLDLEPHLKELNERIENQKKKLEGLL